MLLYFIFVYKQWIKVLHACERVLIVTNPLRIIICLCESVSSTEHFCVF